MGLRYGFLPSPRPLLLSPLPLQVTRPGEETVKCTILFLLNHQVK